MTERDDLAKAWDAGADFGKSLRDDVDWDESDALTWIRAHNPYRNEGPPPPFTFSTSCYVEGCTRYAGWLYWEEQYGEADSCAEHAGYDDWEAMQAEFESSDA